MAAKGCVVIGVVKDGRVNPLTHKDLISNLQRQRSSIRGALMIFWNVFVRNENSLSILHQCGTSGVTSTCTDVPLEVIDTFHWCSENTCRGAKETASLDAEFNVCNTFVNWLIATCLLVVSVPNVGNDVAEDQSVVSVKGSQNSVSFTNERC